MANSVTKLPIRSEGKEPARSTAPAPSPKSLAHPFENLRREIDRVFEDFSRGHWLSPFTRNRFDLEPFWRHELSWGAMPAVDIIDKDTQYEIEAEVPGMDEKNVEVALSDGMLTIKGEKQEEKEEKKKNFHLSERHYGAFQRAFRIPDGVDVDKIGATFSKGVLKVTLPKSADALKKEKKVAIKVA